MISGLLLAAGTSSRMGRAKQLLDWRGQPLVRHVAQQALASTIDELIVVVGFEANAVQAALADLPVRVAVNAAFAEGQASSLRTGIMNLAADTMGVIVLLCDQPLVTPALINSVGAAFAPATQRADESSVSIAVIPRYNGERGNPVLLSRVLFAELAELRGDEGARGVLRRYGNRVRWLDSDDPAVTTDVDTVEQYEALQRDAR